MYDTIWLYYRLIPGRDRSKGVGAVPALGPQVLAGPARLDGQEGGQDLRHRRAQQGVAGAGPAAAARRLARARARAQREQLARARAQQGRENVPPLQERRSTHQVSASRSRLACVWRYRVRARPRPATARLRSDPAPTLSADCYSDS